MIGNCRKVCSPPLLHPSSSLLIKPSPNLPFSSTILQYHHSLPPLVTGILTRGTSLVGYLIATVLVPVYQFVLRLLFYLFCNFHLHIWCSGSQGWEIGGSYHLSRAALISGSCCKGERVDNQPLHYFYAHLYDRTTHENSDSTVPVPTAFKSLGGFVFHPFSIF